MCVVWVLLQGARGEGLGGHATLQGAEGQRPAGGSGQLCRHADQHVQEGRTLHTSTTGSTFSIMTSVFCVPAGNTSVEQCQRVLSQNVKLEGSTAVQSNQQVTPGNDDRGDFLFCLFSAFFFKWLLHVSHLQHLVFGGQRECVV